MADGIGAKFEAAEQAWMIGSIDSVEAAMGWTAEEVEVYRADGTVPLSVISRENRPGPITTGFLSPEALELYEQMQAQAHAQAAPTPVEQPRFAPAAQTEPPVLTMAEAAALTVEDFEDPHVAQALSPVPAELEHVRVGDQVSLEWDTAGKEPGRFTGRVLELSTEDGEEPWIYLKGDGSHMRTPMTGIHIAAHLLYQDGVAIQTSRPEHYRPPSEEPGR